MSDGFDGHSRFKNRYIVFVELIKGLTNKELENMWRWQMRRKEDYLKDLCESEMFRRQHERHRAMA